MHVPLSILLDDGAVYKRTPAGQAALLSTTRQLSSLEHRFLGVVTGYTPLRVLMDMSFDEPGIAQAITRLVERRLIVMVDA